MDSSPSQGAGCGLAFGAVWIGFWTLIVLFFDGFLVVTAAQQLAAQSYPHVPGEVLTSKVTRESDGEGTSLRARVTYRYEVRGAEYTGKNINYGSISFGGHDAHRTASKYRPGKQVPVYYNPRDPADSLLEPGLSAGHGFLSLFLVPFNVVMLGGWAFAWDYFDRGSPTRLPRGVRLRRNYEGFELRLYDASPLAVALVTAGAFAFVSIFVAGFGQRLLPQSWLVGGAWVVVAGLALYAYFRQRRRFTRLAVNELRGAAQVHSLKPGKPVVSLSLDELADVQVGINRKRKVEGQPQSYSVVLVAKCKDGKRKRRVLVRGWTEKPARQLAGWLRRTLRLEKEASSFA